MNNIQLIGRIANEMELRYTTNQKSFNKFTIAVKRDGKEDKTDFINCVAWNSVAEYLYKYTAKGKRIAVTGKLRQEEYTNKDGNKVKTYIVLVTGANIIDYIENTTGNTNVEEVNFDEFEMEYGGEIQF